MADEAKEYITIDGKEPEPAKDFFTKRMQYIMYGLAVAGGILIYFMVVH
jgi:hypothetical protein